MENRISGLRQSLKKKHLDGLLVTNFYNIRYLTGFVGLTPQEREAYLLVTDNQVFLLTDGRYLEQAKTLLPGSRSYSDPGSEKAREKIAKLTSKLAADLKIKRLGIEKNDLRVGEDEELKRYTKRYAAACRLVYIENLVEDLRAVKETEEITKIEKSVAIADKCFAHLLEFIKPGLTEKEVADEIEWFIRKRVDISFDPMVASGINSSMPHYITGNRKVKENDIVLLDFGAKVDGYCSDMTRVVFLGKATDEQKKIYQIILETQNGALKELLRQTPRMVAGRSASGGHDSSEVNCIKAREIDKVARDYLKSQGFKLVHGLGHGVGLLEHEAPRLGPKSRDILKEGMVASLEPGIYIPGKLGIRIEDLVVLEKSGPRVLTKSTKEMIII